MGNNYEFWEEDFNLEKILLPIKEISTSEYSNSVSVSTPLKEILEKLSDDDQLAIEKNGKGIGVVNRQIIIQYLSTRLQERGIQNE